MYMTRCLFDAFKVDTLQPPYDTGIARIYYPGQYRNTPAERDTGAIPLDEARPPCPVLILFSGMNTDPSGYRWLAETLAPVGIVTVTYQLVEGEGDQPPVATPGIDLQALTPEQFGSRPSAIALPAILAMLERLNSKGILANKLDLSRIAFGGHSAGGTLALLNANPSWQPGLRAVFAYAAHTGASTQLGWPEETLLPVSRGIPLLLIGGDQDGCITHSAHHYGSNTTSSTSRIEQSFDRAVPENGGHNALLLLKDANHFSVCSPVDETCGRGFIDSPAETDHAREVVGQAVSLFLKGFLCGDSAALGAYREMTGIDHNMISKLLRK